MFLGSILPAQARNIPEKKQILPGSSIIYNSLAPKHEVRAVWLTTIGGIDWPHTYSQSPYSAKKQQQELCQILDRLQQAKINTVLIQTRIRGTMIYPSDYEPWDGCLSGFPGKTPGYDALQFAIDECHKRGMELHAWVVTIPVGKWEALGCKSLRKKFPGLIRKIGADGYMNPEDSRTSDYLAGICREITHRYNVDGIHLDYIRYPETWKIKVSRDQGRNYITRIVEKIHNAVKSEKPWVKMSCSPVGKYDDLSRYWSHGWNANTKVCQDAQGWLRDGLMDELFPMMYFRGENFYPFAIDWQEQSHGKIVVPGLGIYFLDPKEGKWKIDDVTPEMYLTMQENGLKEINESTAVHNGIHESGYSQCYLRITYSATLTEDAVLGNTSNDNEVVLTWKRTNTEYYDTLKDCCHVYVYGVDLEKQFSDEEGNFEKVQFTVCNDTDKYYVTAELKDGIYYVTGTAEEANATRFVPNEDGHIRIKGMEDDAYIFTEVQTDEGYTLLKDSIHIPAILSIYLRNFLFCNHHQHTYSNCRSNNYYNKQ